MLSKCYNLEHLNLGLDKRAIEDEWPDLSSVSAIWLAIAYKKYWRLRTFSLRGFAVDSRTMDHFFRCHKGTLTGLHFSNCFLSGSWMLALATLRSSSVLEYLALDQISQNLTRVIWSDPYTNDTVDKAFLDDEDIEQWVYIIYTGCPCIFLNFKGRDVAEYLSECLERFHLSSRLADPFVPDALYWFTELLE